MAYETLEQKLLIRQTEALERIASALDFLIDARRSSVPSFIPAPPLQPPPFILPSFGTQTVDPTIAEMPKIISSAPLERIDEFASPISDMGITSASPTPDSRLKDEDIPF
jgi:hypothetical protein